MTTKFGFLPYDTDDDSVIFRCPLTSLASITDIGGEDKSTANNEFDSVKGISPKRNGSDISGLRFRLSVMTLESGAGTNLPQGQMSIELERKALAIPASVASSESDGFDNGADEHLALLTWAPDNTGAAHFGYCYKRRSGTNYDFYAKSAAGGQITGAAYIASNENTSQWATLTVSWTTNKVDIYLDGFLLKTLTRSSNNHLTQFGDIYIGTYGGATTAGNWNNEYYLRNFIMCSRPVTLSYHPVLSHVMMVGDSFAGGQYRNMTTTKGQLNENNVIAGRLNKAGFGFGTFTVYSNGGGTVRDAGHDPLQDDVNGAAKTRATAASEKPTFILFQGGANDISAYDTAFLTDLKDHIKEYMADGTTYTANVAAKRMIIVLQYTGVTMAANLALIHADIKSIPAWWDAAYPSRAGHVQYVDAGSSLTTDGSTPNSDYMNTDTVHPNSLGDYLYGEAIADKMLSMLG